MKGAYKREQSENSPRSHSSKILLPAKGLVLQSCSFFMKQTGNVKVLVMLYQDLLETFRFLQSEGLKDKGCSLTSCPKPPSKILLVLRVLFQDMQPNSRRVKISLRKIHHSPVLSSFCFCIQCLCENLGSSYCVEITALDREIPRGVRHKWWPEDAYTFY